MIGKAKAISHGINSLRYTMGESERKRHPEKINFICCRLLPQGLDAMGVWESMQASISGHERLKNSLIRIELSPAKENTAHFSFRDWEKLWEEFVEEFDKQIMRDKAGKVTSGRTNLADSKGVVYLHEESVGEVPHLHGCVCRVDEEGNVNNDHDIHLRAQRAAEAVARKRGWTTAMGVRTDGARHVTEICEAVLKSMPSWSWDDYVARIEQFRGEGEGLQVKARTDSKGIVRGYTIVKGKVKYKASELGKGRNLTYTRLEATWRKLHPETYSISKGKTVTKQTTPSKSPVLHSEGRSSPRPTQTPEPKVRTGNTDTSSREQKPMVDYNTWTPDRTPVYIEADGERQRLFLPKDVLQLFNDEFDYREVVNWEALVNLACAYFAALMKPVIPGTVGRGPSDQSGWGRDKDEDDLAFARRCAMMARAKLGVRKKTGGIHR